MLEGEQLGSDQIVASFEAIRQLNREVAVIGDELFGTPLASSLVITFIPDLEPATACSSILDSRIDFLEVDGTGTFVGDVNGSDAGIVGPLAVFECENRAGSARADTWDSDSTISACGIVSMPKIVLS